MTNATRRSLLILEEIGRGEQPVGASEIGRKLRIPAATTFRDLDALERTGFAERYQASSRYVLGTTAKRLRQTLFARFPIRDICLPYMRQMAFATGETTSLTVRLGWYAVQIAAVPGTAEVITAPSLGQVQLLTAGAASLAILAFQPEGTLDRLAAWQSIHGMPPSPTLPRQLDQVRRVGYATDGRDFAAGRAAVFLPILVDGCAVASLSIDGPVMAVGDDGPVTALPQWRDMMREMAALAGKLPSIGPFDHLDPDVIDLTELRLSDVS